MTIMMIDVNIDWESHNQTFAILTTTRTITGTHLLEVIVCHPLLLHPTLSQLIRLLFGRQRFPDSFVEGQSVLGDLLEIFEVDFVQELCNEDDMSTNYFVNMVVFDLILRKHFAVIELLISGDLLPYFRKVSLPILVESSFKIIIEFLVFEEFFNSVLEEIVN